MDGISFIMCCHNSEKIMTESLISIFNQDTNIPYELILVNNNCIDNTVGLARKIYLNSNTKASFNIVNENTPGLIFARKKGFVNAQYNYLCFVDDDNIIASDWAKNMYNIFKCSPEVSILGGDNRAMFVDSAKPDWFDQVKGSYACNKQGDEFEDLTYKRMFVYGAGMCIRRKTLKDVYDIELPFFLTGRKNNILLSGDDSEICMRSILQGGNVFYSHKLKLQHVIPKERLTWKYFKKMEEGHFASHLILDIYMRLIQNHGLLSRKDIFKSILIGWIGYAKNHKFKHLNSPGSWSSIMFARRFGKTKGFICFFRCYNNIASQIRKEFCK